MFKTILVPHGGTEAGDNALKHGIYQAKQCSAKIIILHVIEPWSDVSFGYLPVKDQSSKGQIDVIFTNMEEDVRKFLAGRVAKCRNEGVECQGVFIVGKPSDGIIKYANEEKVDLIVMAKKKKIPEYQSLFKIGSVTKKVQEKVDCPN